MSSTVPVQTRVDAEVKERAGIVLGNMGLTVSDAIRILLTRIANEGALPVGLTTDAAAHDAWFRSKVQEALDDSRPALDNEDVKAHFAARRARALKKAAGE
jgi:DNA-damage-inducible protein J